MISLPLQVVLIEDSEDDAALILREISRAGYQVRPRRVETADGLKAALSSIPDLVLCDYALPHFSAPKALGIVKDSGLDLPFIIVSGTIGEEAAVQMMKLGAHDYLMKSNLSRLGAAIRRELTEAKVRAERARAEAAHKEAQALLERSQEIGHMGSWVLSLQGTSKLVCSKEMTRILGVDKGFDGGPSDFLRFVHPDDRREVEEIGAKALRGEIPYALDHRILTPDGVIRWVHEEALIERDRLGNPTRILGTTLDLTDRIRHDELREKGRRLEEEGRRAQEASRLKSEFLTNVSDELRTPLKAIIGFGELLEDDTAGPPSPKQQEYLGHILAGSRHVLNLINDLLDLAKIEAGKMDFNPQPVILPKLVEEVRDALNRAAATKQTQLTVEVDPQVSSVEVDPIRLRQVLYNLLSNAIKFTQKRGEVTVRVLPQGAFFRIEVSDNGPGIAASDVSGLFKAFEQLDLDPSKRGQGSGVGLSLVKRVVEAQGGRVEVQTRPGLGSTFSAVLPRVASPAPDTTEGLRAAFSHHSQ